MAFRDEEKIFIRKQIQNLKASETYHGQHISNNVLAEIAESSLQSASNWSAGRKVMSQEYRENITKALDLDPHYFDLEYSDEFRTKQESAEELNYFLSSQLGALSVQGMTMSKDGLQNLQATYAFLKSLGFDEVVERLESSGDTATVASLIEQWNNVFYNFYETLEPMLEEYCTKTQNVMDSYRPDLETRRGKTVKGFLMLNDKEAEEMENKIATIGKDYSFFLSGAFDTMQSVHLKLYKAFKNPAPKEQDEGE